MLCLKKKKKEKEKKISHPSSLVLPSTRVCACAPAKVHLYMHVFLHINALLCTNMLAKCVMHPKTYNGTKGNKSRSTQSKSMGH